MNKEKNFEYPSKEEIIEALKDDEKLKNFDELMVILEFNRKSDSIGIIKGELIQNDEVAIRGKVTVFPKKMPNSSIWADIDISQSIYYGFSLEFKEETLFDLFSEGFRTSIREGKLPFFHR